MIIVNVSLVLDCNNNETADAVNEILREHQRRFSPESCLLDYALGPASRLSDEATDCSDYVEGDAFVRY